MICLGKYSFMVLFLLENIFFLGFLKEHMVFGWEISLVLFFIVEFFFLLISQPIASLPLKWCRQLKNNKKGNCKAFLDERVVAEKG